MAPSIAPIHPTGNQPRGRMLTARMLRESATVLRVMYPVPPEGPSTLRYRVSRGRNGDPSNPVFLMAEALMACESEAAERRAIAYLVSVVDAKRSTCTQSLRDLMLAEQEVDGAEDYAQLRASMEPAALSAYADALEMQLAAGQRLLARVRRELNAREVA